MIGCQNIPSSLPLFSIQLHLFEICLVGYVFEVCSSMIKSYILLGFEYVQELLFWCLYEPAIIALQWVLSCPAARRSAFRDSFQEMNSQLNYSVLFHNNQLIICMKTDTCFTHNIIAFHCKSIVFKVTSACKLHDKIWHKRPFRYESAPEEDIVISCCVREVSLLLKYTVWMLPVQGPHL